MKQKEETLPTGQETKMPDIQPEPPPPSEPDFLKQYRVCYPDVKKFHVTGDGLVFLDSDYDQAVSHQNTIGKGELKTY